MTEGETRPLGEVLWLGVRGRCPGDGGYVASSGSLLRCNGRVVSRLAVYLGDTTNNVAEYEGVLRCLEHAQNVDYAQICFRLDSLLVARQLQGAWACRAEHLKDLYRRGLRLLESLRNRSLVREIRVEHVYREYNGDADGLANYGIDAYRPREHLDNVVLDDGWRMQVE